MLSAVEAAAAIRSGWLRTAPSDDVATVPLCAAAGPGLIDVLHARLGGSVHASTVRAPLGEPVPATFLVCGEVAYVEAGQVVGLYTDGPTADDEPVVTDTGVERASSYGLGELLTHARDSGVRRVVVGLGDSVTNDGGAGALAAMGAKTTPPEALQGGPDALASLQSLDLEPVRAAWSEVELVIATDATVPLLGLRGTTNLGGAARGVPEDRKVAVDAVLERFAALADGRATTDKGAGAGGGIGYALRVLGGQLRPGFDVFAEVLGLGPAVEEADLVLTGRGRLDWQSLEGPVLAGVSRLSGQALRPCVVLAESVEVGNRELRANGIEAAYGAGETATGDDAARMLTLLAERIARTWSRR